MAHPYPEGTGQDDKRARYDRAEVTRHELLSALIGVGANYEAARVLVQAIEDHAHAIADRLRDGIEVDGVTS